MTVGSTIKQFLITKGIAVLATLLGGAIAVGSLYLTVHFSFETLLNDPLSPSAAITISNPELAFAGVILGIIIWRVGISFASFIVTSPDQRQPSGGMDIERLKSEILEVMDERLAEIHEEMEETRRNVQEIKRVQHAISFNEASLTNQEQPEASSLDSSEPTDATIVTDQDGTTFPGPSHSGIVSDTSSTEAVQTTDVKQSENHIDGDDTVEE